MMIETDGSFTNFDNLHFASNAFTVLRYQNGAISVLPKFFSKTGWARILAAKILAPYTSVGARAQG